MTVEEAAIEKLMFHSGNHPDIESEKSNNGF